MSIWGGGRKMIRLTDFIASVLCMWTDINAEILPIRRRIYTESVLMKLLQTRKVKLSLCLRKHQAMAMYGRVEVWFYHSCNFEQYLNSNFCLCIYSYIRRRVRSRLFFVEFHTSAPFRRILARRQKIPMKPFALLKTCTRSSPSPSISTLLPLWKRHWDRDSIRIEQFDC
jgi:hypothetical protein